MKTIIKILLLSIWSFISFVISVKYIIPPIDFIVTSYFLIWLMGFSIGGLVMRYLVKHDNTKAEYINSNIITVPPSKSKAPNRPPKQK